MFTDEIMNSTIFQENIVYLAQYQTGQKCWYPYFKDSINPGGTNENTGTGIRQKKC